MYIVCGLAWQELAVTVHAYGRMLFYPGQEFMEAFERECAPRIKGMHPQVGG
jgi:hypothetical protein